MVDITETFRYRGAMSSANREGPQQRCETFADDARLHNVRVDVDGIEPSSYAHHVSAFLRKEYETWGVSLGGKTTLPDGVTPISVPPSLGRTYSRVQLAVAAAAAAAAGG